MEKWIKTKVSSSIKASLGYSASIYRAKTGAKRTLEDEIRLRVLDHYIRFEAIDDQGCVALRDISEQNILKKRFLITQKQSNSEVNHGI